MIGPNWAGKTSLFECVAGVLPADSGTVAVGDRVIPPEARGAHMFYMPDGIAPWPAQTVAWALDFTLGLFGGDRGRLAGVVERMQIGPLLRRRIGRLSKGERKRALLAIALLPPQPILLADEPFDGLDLRQSREVGAALRDHAAEGRTLFLSIHQIGDAVRVCDRVVSISGGRTCGEGTFDELTAMARARGAAAPGFEEMVKRGGRARQREAEGGVEARRTARATSRSMWW